MQAIIKYTDLQKEQFAFVMKWLSSIIQIFGYVATALQLTPLNLYLFSIGITGWFIVGLLWNDKAIIIIHIIAFGAMVLGLSNS